MCDGQMYCVWCSLHISVQWDMEKGKQEGHGENQSCYYLGEATGSTEAEAEFGCLLLLAIVHLLIFLPLLLGPRPFILFLCDNRTQNGIILPDF